MGDLSVMVLAAGLGTRLHPLTDLRAKPMVPIGDRPAIAHVVAHLRRTCAPSRIVVNVHHRPEELEAWAAAEGALVSHEAALLGTAGGVAHAAHLLGPEDVLVWNGDVLSPFDPAPMVATHREGSARGTLAVHRRPAGHGNVGFDADGRITRLRRTSFGGEIAGGEFLGIHVVGRDLRAKLPSLGCLVGDVYLPALAEGEVLRAFVTEETFVDVGTLRAYLDANLAWLKQRGADSFVGEGALVTSTIAQSVVGRGAVVDVPLERCVVWPEARVPSTSALRDCIVTPSGIVRVPSEASET